MSKYIWNENFFSDLFLNLSWNTHVLFVQDLHTEMHCVLSFATKHMHVLVDRILNNVVFKNHHG